MPSESYLADGEVISSILSIVFAGIWAIKLFGSPWISFPSIKIKIPLLPLKVISPSILILTEGKFLIISNAVPPTLFSNWSVLKDWLSILLEKTDFSPTIVTSFKFDPIESEIGDAVKISNIKLPEGVTPTISDRDFVIATLVPPTVEVETKSEEETTEEGGTEEKTDEKTEANKEEPKDKKEEDKESK